MQCNAPAPGRSTAASLGKCSDGTKPTTDGGMFDGMIRPLLNSTIKGAIWCECIRTI